MESTSVSEKNICTDCKTEFMPREGESDANVCGDCMECYEKCDKCEGLYDPFDEELQAIGNNKYCSACICHNCYDALIYENEVCYKCAIEIEDDDERERERYGSCY
jgi:hypothetical protein